jgi:formate dehydrogenase subunit beta
MRVLIPVENDDVTAAVRGLLARLLEAQVVEALVVPMETPAGAVTPTLVADPALLDSARPLTPVMGLNAARVVGHVTPREPERPVGAVLRPCELRALVELVKLKQANPDGVLTIGIDCPGTIDVATYTTLQANGGVDPMALLAAAGNDEADPEATNALRDACQMCEAPHVENADVTIELFGADLSAGLPVDLPDDVADKLGLSPAEESGTRVAVVEKVVSARTAVRDARLAEMRRQLDEKGIEDVLAACVRCHNCMTACPICYCRTCLFKSPTFEHEPARRLAWARRKGALRLPTDTMLFHLTRLNHMALSCIGCGMCTSACPAKLPVGRVFRAIGGRLQETFEYVPGRSVDEPLPLVTFDENEWEEMGEE